MTTRNRNGVPQLQTLARNENNNDGSLRHRSAREPFDSWKSPTCVNTVAVPVHHLALGLDRKLIRIDRLHFVRIIGFHVNTCVYLDNAINNADLSKWEIKLQQNKI